MQTEEVLDEGKECEQNDQTHIIIFMKPNIRENHMEPLTSNLKPLTQSLETQKKTINKKISYYTYMLCVPPTHG